MTERHKLDTCGQGEISGKCGKCNDFPGCREEQARRLNAYVKDQGWTGAAGRKKGGVLNARTTQD